MCSAICWAHFHYCKEHCENKRLRKEDIIMKLSRYNIEKKEDKSCLIYNTVTSAILELDTDYEKSYYEMKEGKKCSKPDLESALLEGGMLVEDDKDEFAELLIRNKIERFADSNLTLTIAPTMACNFCCPYCYEKGREYITMSETVQDQLTSQLKEKYQHIHELTVSWYGGEPLLAIETIEKLTKKIKSVLPLGCKYNADMVTNGYKLTRRVAEKLKDMDIHYIQVTLDGSKQAHDSRRILHNHQPTFEHILDNIRECADILNISIRINVDKTNINEATAMLKFIFLLLLLYVGKEIVCYVNKILYIRIQTNAAFSLNFEIVNHLKKVSPLVIGRTDLSYLSQRINNDANDVLIFFISSLTELIFSVFSAGIILFMIWKMDSIAFIVTMFLLALYFFIYIGFKKRIYNCSYGMKEEKSNFFSRLQEQLEKIEFIKIHSMDSFFLNRLVASYQKLYRSIFKQQATIQAFANLEGIVGAISVCILLWIGGKKILTGDMQIGYFYMISVYFNMILEYGKEIVAYGQEYQEAYVSFERIKSILEIKEQSKGCIRLNEIKQIRIQDLNFAYDQKETIKSFSTNLKKGKVYGLKGENGCGKSTLIKILMGMYVDEYQGNIIWNDTEMRNLDMDYIREHVISVTEQEPTLIADTIYNNIALYRKLDVKCIQRAVDCFGDSILKRDNWDLQINEKSSNISGGEKQKIAIIRQVVQDGQVMIFDEPTSAMDESGKKQFLQLIDQIKNHKIIIIVSHDNAILNTCDEILIL